MFTTTSIIPYVIVWGSCFSLGSRRFSSSFFVRRVFPPYRLYNLLQPYFSHLTYHSTIHYYQLPHLSQLIIALLLIPHLSHLYFLAPPLQLITARFFTPHLSQHNLLTSITLLIIIHHSSVVSRLPFAWQVHYTASVIWTSLNLIRCPHHCTPELFWIEDPISLRCWEIAIFFFLD